MDDRVEIVGELWSAGLRADLMYDDAVSMGIEEVMAECLAQGILYVGVFPSLNLSGLENQCF